MTRLLAVDPGPVESAWVLINDECWPIDFGKQPNDEVREMLRTVPYPGDTVAIEMVASYGMPVGAEVFDTCVHIGRFIEAAGLTNPRLVFRRDVKLHHCGTSKAKDSNIIQALIDRFAPGQPNRGKGTKAEPGWFFGFRADVWQAYALAVYAAETTTVQP